MATKQKVNSPNVVITMPSIIKRIAREMSIEVCDDYRSLSKYITVLILLDKKYGLLKNHIDGDDNIFTWIDKAKKVNTKEEYSLFINDLLAA